MTTSAIRRTLAALAVAAAVTLPPAPRAMADEEFAASGANIVPATPGLRGGLVERYRQVERRLVAQGRLRQDPAPADAPFTVTTLQQHFLQTAMFHEYRASGGGFRAQTSASVLRRWEKPVRLSLVFGASVDADRRRADQREVARIAQRLSRVTGHPISMVASEPNFYVFVVSDAEQRALGQYLKQRLPGLSDRGLRAVRSMPPSTLCMVMALPARDARYGYRAAVAIVRAEHPNRMRKACFQEEIAQGLGLPNDSDARPSIFNDDEEFGVLTRHDELLLRMLYDRRLTPGMTIRQVKHVLGPIARAAMSSI